MSKPSTYNLLPLLAAPPAAPEAQAQDFTPFHILIADHLAPALSPPLLPVGHLTPQLLAEVHAFNKHLVHDMQDRQAFDLYPVRSGNLAQVNLRDVICVAFREDVVQEGQLAMSRAMDRLVWFMRGRGALPIKKFAREDLISAFADPRSAMFDDGAEKVAGEDLPHWGNVAFRSLRTVKPSFKMIQLGVHLVVYEGEGKDMKLWIQRRGPNVGYPGMLDSTAGGAIEAGLTAIDAVCREAEEECGYPADIVHKYARCTGALAALKNGRLTNMFYELKRPSPDSPDYEATQPRLGDDDECAGFELMSIPQVIQALQEGKFQPVTPYIIVHFLIRHDLINKDNDEQYDELVECLKRKIPVPLPHKLEETIQDEGV